VVEVDIVIVGTNIAYVWINNRSDKVNGERDQAVTPKLRRDHQTNNQVVEQTTKNKQQGTNKCQQQKKHIG